MKHQNRLQTLLAHAAEDIRKSPAHGMESKVDKSPFVARLRIRLPHEILPELNEYLASNKEEIANDAYLQDLWRTFIVTYARIDNDTCMLTLERSTFEDCQQWVETHANIEQCALA